MYKCFITFVSFVNFKVLFSEYYSCQIKQCFSDKRDNDEVFQYKKLMNKKNLSQFSYIWYLYGNTNKSQENKSLSIFIHNCIDQQKTIVGINSLRIKARKKIFIIVLIIANMVSNKQKNHYFTDLWLIIQKSKNEHKKRSLLIPNDLVNANSKLHCSFAMPLHYKYLGHKKE